MTKSTKRILAALTLGMTIVAGCDANPDGPSFPTPPVATADTPEQNAASGKKSGRKPAPAKLNTQLGEKN